MMLAGIISAYLILMSTPLPLLFNVTRERTDQPKNFLVNQTGSKDHIVLWGWHSFVKNISYTPPDSLSPIAQEALNSFRPEMKPWDILLQNPRKPDRTATYKAWR